MNNCHGNAAIDACVKVNVQPGGSGTKTQWNNTEFCARLFSICVVSGEDSAALSLSKQGTVSLLHDKHSVCENMHHSFDCRGKFEPEVLWELVEGLDIPSSLSCNLWSLPVLKARVSMLMC